VALELHIGLLPDRPVAEIAELVEQAERLGFAGAWIADSQSIFRDAYAALTLAAARTSRIALATGVTNPVTRHIAVVASAAATLDELSDGRAILGLGVGESAVRTIGRRPARLAELERATATLRTLLAGEEASDDGVRLRLVWPTRPVPVWLASSGPRSLAVAGRIADGVLFQVGAEPELVRWALGRIDEGAGGRRVGRLVRLACSVDVDRERARERVRGYVAAAAGTAFANVPRESVPADLWEDMRAMKERYDYFGHTRAGAEHTTLVTERILDGIAVAGTPDEVVPRLRELGALGVDGFVIPVTGDDPGEAMRVLAEEVAPRLG
jgi:5,10-methylenetetrahydromethanopterin reductase